MNIELITVIMFASMVLLLLTGRHIFLIVGAVGTISALMLWGPGGAIMPYMHGYAFLKWSPLIAVPPFIFMGSILSSTGIADRLFHAFYLWMGRIKGGLAMASMGLCALIAAMSGLQVAGTVIIGKMAVPALLKRNYDKRMITGIAQAGGALGVLIPPSIVFILYGVIARVSIGHLWVAGIIPGLLLTGMYMAYIGIRCNRNPSLGPPIPAEEMPPLKEKLLALRGCIAPLVLIFAVLGLLFMGVTTLNESAAIGAAGAFILAVINRRINFQVIEATMKETLSATSMILWVFSAALLFSAVFDGLGAVHAMENMLRATGGVGGSLGIIAVMQLSFFLMGMILDDTAMLLIVAPLYIPMVASLGYSLVWYGVLYVVNCQMAFLTPPFGYNLFIMKGVAPKEITMMDIYRSVIPFVIIQAACLGIIIAFPQIALWLPSIVFHG